MLAFKIITKMTVQVFKKWLVYLSTSQFDKHKLIWDFRYL